MLVTIACEHSPLFPANMDSEGLLTLDYTVMQSVLEWYNSLTKHSESQAYFLPDQRLFVFPTNEAEWETLSEEPDGTFLAPDWLTVQPACPECLCYTPCDCEHQLLCEQDLASLEAYCLTTHDISMEQVRNLIYTIRELEAQLKVEQEVHK
jgi:hypothetical protein